VDDITTKDGSGSVAEGCVSESRPSWIILSGKGDLEIQAEFLFDFPFPVLYYRKRVNEGKMR
jgi:hypothetical protein